MPGGARFHNVIFVATEANGDGREIHVTGAIGDTNGMKFEERPGGRPESSDTYHQKYYLGEIRPDQYEAFLQLVRSVPAPPQQRVYIGTRGWVPCKPYGSLYQPGETVPPYIKCTEWVLDRAIPALQQGGFCDPMEQHD